MTQSPVNLTLAAAVAAAQEGAILVDRSELGHLVFRGDSRLDLVHRMSTQAVTALTTGQGAATVLTTDIGRIIDRLLLYAAEDAVLVVTGDANADSVARYLMRFVFFNDDFQIEDRSEETAAFGVYGQQAEAQLGAALGLDLAFPLHHWRRASLGESSLTVHRTDAVAGAGYLLLVAQAQAAAAWKVLNTAGLQPISAAAFDYLRIAAGVPRFGRELTQEYIPLEADLWADVSFSKGCYIGQEIIARLESRGRLAKRLALLRLRAPVPAGAALEIEGKNAGTITSVAEGPAGTLALAYIKANAFGRLDALTAAGEPVNVLSDWAREPGKQITD
jgi:aminomethyltransferase